MGGNPSHRLGPTAGGRVERDPPDEPMPTIDIEHEHTRTPELLAAAHSRGPDIEKALSSGLGVGK
jgi:hypothetical protein